MRMRKRVVGRLSVIFGGICLALGASIPAHASLTLVNGPNTANLSTSGQYTSIYVCDNAPGNAVYVEYKVYSIPGYVKLYDSNGMASGCGDDTVFNVTTARLCVNTQGCTNWSTGPW